MKGVPVNNTLVRHAVFLAADTPPRVLMEELESANNETLSSDSPQGDAETSIVLPGQESVETTQKSIRCDGGSTDIDNNGVE